jgi:hypothetical protein
MNSEVIQNTTSTTIKARATDLEKALSMGAKQHRVIY